MTEEFIEFTALRMVIEERPQHEVVQYVRDHFLDGELANFHLQVDALYEAIGVEHHRREMLRAARRINTENAQEAQARGTE